MKQYSNYLFPLYILLSFFTISQKVEAQTITLSSPPSGFTLVNSSTVILGISGETGGISNIRLVFTYVSGYYKSRIGRKDSVTLASTASSHTFTFDPNTITTDSRYSANTGNLVDGVYSIQANYKRVANNAIVRSNIANLVTFDTQALPIYFNTPIANSTVKGIFAYHDTIPEPFAVKSKQLSIRSVSTGKTTTITFLNSKRVTKFDLNSSYIPNSNNILSTTDTTLSDGNYFFSLTYRDLSGHNATPVERFVTIDSKTLPPSILKPVNNSKQNSLLDLLFTIPEQMNAGSVKLLFKKSGGGTDSLVLANPIVGINTYQLDLKNLNSPNISNSSITTLPDGVYDIILKYQDAIGNVSSSTTISNFTLDNTTISPTLNSPLTDLTLRARDVLNVTFNLPEKALQGSVKAHLMDSTNTYPVILNAIDAGTYSFAIDPSNVNSSTGVVSSLVNKIPDGTYNFQLSYQDELGNPISQSTTKSVTFDTETQAISNISPTDSSTVIGNLSISFNLPEIPKDNKVFLTLRNCEDINVELRANSIGIQNFIIDPQNLELSTGILQSSRPNIPSGTYTLIIGYQDVLGNSFSYTSKKGIIF